MENELKIISEPNEKNPFVVIYKPRGIPSAPLTLDDENSALNFAIKKIPKIKNVVGKKQIEYGLLHRIDTATAGLLLIATTQSAYDFFIEEQKSDKFIKRYKASCNFVENISRQIEGFPQCENFSKLDYFLFNDSPYVKKLELEQKSYFRFFGKGRKEVRPVIAGDKKAALNKASEKLYKTKITVFKDDNKITTICQITNGFRHQVRCHLAWLGIPVKNDLVYNPIAQKRKKAQEQNSQNLSISQNSQNLQNEMQFTAYELEFTNPKTFERVKFSIE